jgi:hypothetical protein
MKILTAILGAVFISLTVWAEAPPALHLDQRLYTGEEGFLYQTKEGFQPSTPNVALTTAWEGTYAVTDGAETNPKISGAVLVFRQIVNGHTYLGFLTSGHTLLKLTSVKPYKPMIISKNIKMVDRLEVVERLLAPVVWTSVNMNYDLGIIVVHAGLMEIDDSRPVEFSPNCQVKKGDRVALMGFPGVFKRQVEDQNQPIMAPTIVTKRVSEGRYTGESKYGEDQAVRVTPLVGITNDSMTGNSGGSALNTKGQLIGILVGTLAKEQNQYRYEGSDQPRNLRSHSFISNCQVTKIFAHEMWKKFLGTLPTSI